LGHRKQQRMDPALYLPTSKNVSEPWPYNSLSCIFYFWYGQSRSS
jgi:hypothetical protein